MSSAAAAYPVVRPVADPVLDTPAVVVDETRLMANIARVAAIGRTHGVAVRPHVKTHKCLEIARAQLAAGAVGITCSKPEEALVFLRAGVPSVTLAYPLVDPARARRLLEAAREAGAAMRFIADSDAGVAALAAAAGAAGATAAVFLKVDVGLHRCGVAEGDPRLVPLVQSIDRAPGLAFAGLLSHAGHAYGMENRAGARMVAREEAAIMARVKTRLARAGVEVPEVSVGSTPTVLASDAYEGITEIRPGNYVFVDLSQVRLGVATFEDVALHVLATVVSANDAYAIVDAGSKVLSSDLRPHSTGGGGGFGLAFPEDGPMDPAAGLPVLKLSEEHGWIGHGGRPPAIGSRVRIVPNHSCPVANLADAYAVVAPGRPARAWAVAARGKVH